jgi:hypothetical protein
MDYLCHFEFCAWNKKMVSQEAEIEAIPMVLFRCFSKMFHSDVPLHHQFSITTQRSFKFSVVNEMLKCF